jgi:outer membrane protein
MRILTFLATLAIAVALAPTASAAELKIGYVDLQQALNEVDEGKAAKAQLKKDFDDKQKRLDREQSELKRMKEDLDKQAVVMADDARREKQGELDRKFMEVQGLFVQLQKELSEREREVTRGIFEKMTQIIREIAEADGFTLVFERTDAGLVYAPKSLDLTSDLIRKYNARYKGAGAGTGTGADAGKKKAEPAKK